MAFNAQYYQTKKQKLNQGFINKMGNTLVNISNLLNDFQNDKSAFENEMAEIAQIEKENTTPAPAKPLHTGKVKGSEIKKEEIKK